MAIAFQQLWPRPEPPKKPTNTINMNNNDKTVFDRLSGLNDRLTEMYLKRGWNVLSGGYQPFGKVDTLNPPKETGTGRFTYSDLKQAFEKLAKASAEFNGPISIYKHQQPGFSCMPIINPNPFKTNPDNMEKILTLDLKTARDLYPQADAAFKKVLEGNFGAKALAKDIIDRLGDFNDVLAYHGITPAEFDGDTFDLEHDEVCYKALKLIVSAYNEGKVPDWNSNQKKWQPVFDMSHPSGFGFSHSLYYSLFTITRVGSRLCFLEERCLLDAVKKFEKYYRGFYVIEK